ncbi:MAG: hypothetical protein AAFV19_12565 [Pseudomonadota bacterium]
MTAMILPPARDFGWLLKDPGSTRFEIDRRANGQFTVVLNHALLRGVTSEMIHWWFLNFTRLRIRLEDVPGYEGALVPAYLLWHPSDHVDAVLKGRTGPGGTAQAGARIHIREAMQTIKYGLRYPVDAELMIHYCAGDGWAMGRALPLIGQVMCLRIHYRDVTDRGRHLGVHYHYEVVIGASGNNPLLRAFNRKLTAQYSLDFFEAWHLHNTIEVGTFENFLPALYEQRDKPTPTFARDMNSAAGLPAQNTSQDQALFARRVAALAQADDPFDARGAVRPSIL